MKLKIKKGDLVQVITGDDKRERSQASGDDKSKKRQVNKAKVGRVLEVYPEKMRILVEGVNMVKKHTRPSQTNPKGGIQSIEAAVHYSNVMLIDSDKKRTRVGTRVETKDNQIVKKRFAKSNGQDL
jgi:large subunit ribosomal protein L24